MKFEAARVEGQRVVERLLQKFRQDSGNAKWIGRMALTSIEQRLGSNRPSAPQTAVVESAEDTLANPNRSVTTRPVSPWSILSAAELIERITICSREEVESILAEERSKLARASVIDAAVKRLG